MIWTEMGKMGKTRRLTALRSSTCALRAVSSVWILGETADTTGRTEDEADDEEEEGGEEGAA